MNIRKKSILVAGGVILGCVAAYALWRTAAAGDHASQARKVLYYQDSMHPWIKSDKPGKCTVCAMDLTPILEGDQGFGVAAGTVALSSNSITVLDVQTDEVVERPLQRTLRVAGTLEANETKRTVVSAPAIGRVDGLFVDYAGIEVAKGDPLVTFYSPGFANQTRRFAFLGGLARPTERLQADSAAHAGMRMADMDTIRSGPTQLNQNLDPRKGLDTTTYFTDLLAPQSGTVVQRNVYKGQYVQEGEKMFTIVDSSTLWFRFDVYEQHLPWLELGQKLTVSLPAMPGKTFSATISFIEPTINEATRTVRVRADIQNPLVGKDGQRRRLLHYGMYAEGRVQAEIQDVLSVPRSAVLMPGDRAFAYVEKAHGVYERRPIQLGRQGDDGWEVLEGLEEGDRVVTSGNVLIDAQAQFSQGAEPEKSCCHKEDGAATTAAAEAPASEATGAGMNHGASDMHALHPSPAVSPAATAPPAEHTAAPRETARGGRLSSGSRIGEAIGARLAGSRSASTNQAASATPASGSSLSEAGRKAIEEFLAVADGISQALAGDNLPQFNQQIGKLRAIVPALEKEWAAPHRWQGLVRRFAVLSQLPAAKDLAEARKQFLPFSVGTVELAKQLRAEDKAFAGLKVYFCPMAPKPGVWFQAKGPLRNPYYGAEMLTCGEEVKGNGSLALSQAANPSK